MAKIKQHSDKVWLVEAHTDEYDVRGVVIVGDNYAVVWDTLSHPDDMRGVHALLGNLPFYVVYSHADWDHIWGNAGLTRSPQAIIAHEITLQRFATDVPLTLQEKQQEKQLEKPGQWDAVVLVPPTITFAHWMTLHLGGLTLQLHSLPGHTKDCIIGFIPELGLWLGGDTIETPLPVIEYREDMVLWTVALKSWSEDERIRSVIPAHGEIGDRTEIRKTYDYLSQLLSGAEVDVPANMPEFYVATHAQNRAIIGQST